MVRDFPHRGFVFNLKDKQNSLSSRQRSPIVGMAISNIQLVLILDRTEQPLPGLTAIVVQAK